MRITNLGIDNIPYKLSNIFYHGEKFFRGDFRSNETINNCREFVREQGLEAWLLDSGMKEDFLQEVLSEIVTNDNFDAITVGMDYNASEKRILKGFFESMFSSYQNDSQEWNDFYTILLQDNLDDLTISDDIVDTNDDNFDIDDFVDSDNIMKYHDEMGTKKDNAAIYVLDIVLLFVKISKKEGWSDTQLMNCIKWGISGLVQEVVFTEGNSDNPVDFGYDLNKVDFANQLNNLQLNEDLYGDIDWKDVILDIYGINDESSDEGKAEYVATVKEKISEVEERGNDYYFWHGMPNTDFDRTFDEDSRTCMIFEIYEDGQGFEIHEFQKNDELNGYGDIAWEESVWTFVDNDFNEIKGYSDERAEMNENGWGITPELTRILKEKYNEYFEAPEDENHVIENFGIDTQTGNDDDDDKIDGTFSFNYGTNFVNGEFTYTRNTEGGNLGAVSVDFSEPEYDNKYAEDMDFQIELDNFIDDNIDHSLFGDSDDEDVDSDSFDATDDGLGIFNNFQIIVQTLAQNQKDINGMFNIDNNSETYEGQFTITRTPFAKGLIIDYGFDFEPAFNNYKINAEDFNMFMSNKIEFGYDESLWNAEVSDELIEWWLRNEVASDEQFAVSEPYKGFLNTGGDIVNEPGRTYCKAIAADYEKWNNWCLENLNIGVSGSPDGEEVIFSHSADYPTKNTFNPDSANFTDVDFVAEDGDEVSDSYIGGNLNYMAGGKFYTSEFIYSKDMSFEFIRTMHDNKDVQIDAEIIDDLTSYVKEHLDVSALVADGQDANALPTEFNSITQTFDKGDGKYQIDCIQGVAKFNYEGEEQTLFFKYYKDDSIEIVDTESTEGNVRSYKLDAKLEELINDNVDLTLFGSYVSSFEGPEDSLTNENQDAVNWYLEAINKKGFPNPIVNISYPYKNVEGSVIVNEDQMRIFLDEISDSDSDISGDFFNTVEFKSASLSPEYQSFGEVMNTIMESVTSEVEGDGMHDVYLTFPVGTDFLLIRWSVSAESWGFIEETFK